MTLLKLHQNVILFVKCLTYAKGDVMLQQKEDLLGDKQTAF